MEKKIIKGKRGGWRPNSGRKTNKDRKNIQNAIDYLTSTDHLLMNLVDIANDTNASASDRIRANQSLLDYRFGKARQSVDVEVNSLLDGKSIQEIEMLENASKLMLEMREDEDDNDNDEEE